MPEKQHGRLYAYALHVASITFAESYLCMIYLLGQGYQRHSQEYNRSIRRKASSPGYRYILRQYNSPHFAGISALYKHNDRDKFCA